MTTDASKASRTSLDPARYSKDPERAPDIGRPSLGSAIPHPGIVNDLAVIGAWSGKTQPERAGHGGLRPARVGRTVLARVAQHGARCI